MSRTGPYPTRTGGPGDLRAARRSRARLPTRGGAGKLLQIANDASDRWPAGASGYPGSIDPRGRRRKGERSCDALRGAASPLAHGHRLDDGRKRFAGKQENSR